MTAAWAPIEETTPQSTGDDWSWQLRGRCLEFPTELFFPEEETRKRIRREREQLAKRICLQCPVLRTCRDHALTTPEKYGVWGATTARERALAAAVARVNAVGD